MSQLFFDGQGNVRTDLTYNADYEKIEYFLSQLGSVHPCSRATQELENLEAALMNSDPIEPDEKIDWEEIHSLSEDQRYIAEQTARFVSVFREEFGHNPVPELGEHF